MTDTSRYFVEALEALAYELERDVDDIRARKDGGWYGMSCTATRIRAILADAPEEKTAQEDARRRKRLLRHGVDCQKRSHRKEGGYLHEEEDDRPYSVDGVEYCGRCHAQIDMPVVPPEDEAPAPDPLRATPTPVAQTQVTLTREAVEAIWQATDDTAVVLDKLLRHFDRQEVAFKMVNARDSWHKTAMILRRLLDGAGKEAADEQ